MYVYNLFRNVFFVTQCDLNRDITWIYWSCKTIV